MCPELVFDGEEERVPVFFNCVKTTRKAGTKHLFELSAATSKAGEVIEEMLQRGEIGRSARKRGSVCFLHALKSVTEFDGGVTIEKKKKGLILTVSAKTKGKGRLSFGEMESKLEDVLPKVTGEVSEPISFFHHWFGESAGAAAGGGCVDDEEEEEVVGCATKEDARALKAKASAEAISKGLKGKKKDRFVKQRVAEWTQHSDLGEAMKRNRLIRPQKTKTKKRKR